MRITINISLKSSLSHAWNCWTDPAHIIQWNFAGEDWHCPAATNDLREGGEFHYEMAARDGSMSFDFWGTYKLVAPLQKIEYLIGDGRHVSVTFTDRGDCVEVTESFEPETIHSHELQQQGWQMILDRFRRHVENSFAQTGI